MGNFYEVLGIAQSACDAEVRSAYRRQALATHPDKGGVAEVFHRVLQAFETLGDSTRRAEYDRSLRCHLAFTSGAGVPRRPKDGTDGGLCRPPKCARRRATSPESEAAAASAHGRVSRTQPGVGVSRPSGDPCSAGTARTTSTWGHSTGCDAGRGPRSSAAPSSSRESAEKDENFNDGGCDESCIHALFEQLLKLPRSEVAHRLSKLSEAKLGKLVAELKSRIFNKEGGNEGAEVDEVASSTDVASVAAAAFTAADSAVVALHPASRSQEVELPGCTEHSSSDEGIVDDDEPADLRFALCDAGLPEPARAQADRTSRGSTTHGVHKISKRYLAGVSLEHVTIYSRESTTLEDALDIHIGLVQLKERVVGSLMEGVDFRTALATGIDIMRKDRDAAGARKEHLHFRVCCFWLQGQKSWRTQDMEKAMSIWEQHASTRSQHRIQRRRMKLEKLKQGRPPYGGRPTHGGRQKRESEQVRHWQWVLSRISSMLKEKVQSRRRLIKQIWKVADLPEGLELAKFRSDGDCVCGILTLQDGSTKQGPLRQSIAGALSDLLALRALQNASGDAVACAELEVRDVQAMTVFFASELSGGRRCRT
mmetsp:Transcript_14224/g.49976  ORF Transcript_14224/g.49976 Transcript_14224/m.49976 type:complete len:595 (+) Transcript_14224:44-1828(+)